MDSKVWYRVGGLCLGLFLTVCVCLAAPGGKAGAEKTANYAYYVTPDTPYFVKLQQGMKENGTLKKDSKIAVVNPSETGPVDMLIFAYVGANEVEPITGPGPFTHKTKDDAKYYLKPNATDPALGTLLKGSQLKLLDSGAALVRFEVRAQVNRANVKPIH
jgi:hypothetical protein